MVEIKYKLKNTLIEDYLLKVQTRHKPARSSSKI